MDQTTRHATGIHGLDERLGGGLIAGTLTVIVGATGIGKTQLGLQFANAGHQQEGHRGLVFDMSARGDSQNHRQYAQRMFQWPLLALDPQVPPILETFFDDSRSRCDYLRVFGYRGQRVTRRDLDFQQWHQWHGELNAKLSITIAFMYGNFLRGCRRVVVDGIEPVCRPGESIQFNLFEYIYHQILRKESDWVARDLFREKFRLYADQVVQHHYDVNDISCLLLCTSQETILDDLISRGIDEGDVLANANTVIYMGRIRDGNHISRALYIAKHRGSASSEEIIPYSIGDRGCEIRDA